MCADGVDLGLVCPRCGEPLLSCEDDGPTVSWHASAADALECAARTAGGKYAPEWAEIPGINPAAAPGQAGAAAHDAGTDVQ